MNKEAEELLQRINALEGKWEKSSKETHDDYDRILESIHNFADNIKAIESEFDEVTQLKKEDIPFVIFCTGFQAFRQYFVTDFKKRVSDKQASKIVKGDKEEKSNRNKSRYYCSLENIVSNPVPFDALLHDENIETGISGGNHRTKCLGHYPELGYVFGTANIMTSTITTKEGLGNIQTYHVKTEAIQTNKFFKKSGETKQYINNLDYIYSKAHTSKMFEHCYSRIKKNPQKGILALIAALGKEHEHLRSDEITKQSLPFPLLSFTPEIAEALRNCGFDFVNLKTVTKQASYSYFINLITEILYYAYHLSKQLANGEEMKKLSIDDTVKVRLSKIINVANVISTSTNLVAVIVGIFTKDENLIRKFDIGGELVTCHHLSNSADFILKIKEEYIKSKINILNSRI